MLAVNGKVSSYCVHLQLENSKIYLEGFPPAQITFVGTTFAKHLSLWNAIFPIKMPPSTKSGVGVYEDRGGHPDHRSTLPVP